MQPKPIIPQSSPIFPNDVSAHESNQSPTNLHHYESDLLITTAQHSFISHNQSADDRPKLLKPHDSDMGKVIGGDHNAARQTEFSSAFDVTRLKNVPPIQFFRDQHTDQVRPQSTDVWTRDAALSGRLQTITQQTFATHSTDVYSENVRNNLVFKKNATDDLQLGLDSIDKVVSTAKSSYVPYNNIAPALSCRPAPKCAADTEWIVHPVKNVRAERGVPPLTTVFGSNKTSVVKLPERVSTAHSSFVWNGTASKSDNKKPAAQESEKIPFTSRSSVQEDFVRPTSNFYPKQIKHRANIWVNPAKSESRSSAQSAYLPHLNVVPPASKKPVAQRIEPVRFEATSTSKADFAQAVAAFEAKKAARV